MDNNTIAKHLRDHAHRLTNEGASLYRVRAYRQAAEVVQGLDQAVSDLVEEGGRRSLESIPGIGSHLAYTIEHLVRTGEFRTLRPEDEPAEPHQRLTSLPGIGPFRAQALRDRLGVQRVEELQEAVMAGRLAEVKLGSKRERYLTTSLNDWQTKEEPRLPLGGEPEVEDILAMDREFRSMAIQAPCDEARLLWLPPFRRERNGWRFRVRFSRTALACRLNQTRDWVEVHFEDGVRSGVRLVVTETNGSRKGQRVVRGRERE